MFKYVIGEYNRSSKHYEHLSEFLNKEDAYDFWLDTTTITFGGSGDSGKPSEEIQEIEKSQYRTMIKDRPSSPISYVLFTIPVGVSNHKHFRQEIEKMIYHV